MHGRKKKYNEKCHRDNEVKAKFGRRKRRVSGKLDERHSQG
jgi:hypothetical protein